MNNPKFSTVEILLGLLVTLSIDVLALIFDLVSIDTGWLVQIATWLIFTFWFTIKGVKATASLVKRFLIPIAIQFLPDWILPAQLTITFFITTYVENHPKIGFVAAIAEKKFPRAPKK